MSMNKTHQSNSSSELQPELILELEKENFDLKQRKEEIERTMLLRSQEMERKRAIMLTQIQELEQRKSVLHFKNG